MTLPKVTAKNDPRVNPDIQSTETEKGFSEVEKHIAEVEIRCQLFLFTSRAEGEHLAIL